MVNVRALDKQEEINEFPLRVQGHVLYSASIECGLAHSSE